MKIPFVKYQGTGNDFVLIDNRPDYWGGTLPDQAWIERLCHRRFGIGADGLMLLQPASGFDFEMLYYNADGRLGSMCGNGGRCIVAFAHSLGLVPSGKARFVAGGKVYEADIEPAAGLVHLQMQPVERIEILEPNQAFFLDTGSPHYVGIVPDLDAVDVVGQGRAIRHRARFAPGGTNVNFIELLAPYRLRIATYERGVEDETYSCGTGAVASALVAACLSGLPEQSQGSVLLHTKGGDLRVSFRRISQYAFDSIALCGPAQAVFEGIVEYPRAAP